jgi:hypothetical protein
VYSIAVAPSLSFIILRKMDSTSGYPSTNDFLQTTEAWDGQAAGNDRTAKRRGGT